MGCTSNNVLEHHKITYDNTKSSSFNYDNYEKLYSDAKINFFDIFDEESIERINRISEGPVEKIEDEIKKLIKEKRKQMSKNMRLSKDELFEVILLEISKKYLTMKESLYYQEYDVFSIIEQKVKAYFLVNNKDKVERMNIKDVSEFLESIEVAFPKKQKVLNFFLDKTYSIIKYYKRSLFVHMLLSEELKPDSLNIYFTPLLFKSIEVIDILEYIVRKRQLNFLNIMIHPIQAKEDMNSKVSLDSFNFDSSMYGKIITILNSALDNNSIKVLSLSITKNFKVVVPPEVSDLILKIIEKDNLIGLWLGRLSFANSFYSNLERIICNNTNLSFIGINSDSISKEGMEHLTNILQKTASLKVIILSGMNFPNESEMDEISSLVKKNKSIHFLYYNRLRLNIEDLDQEEPPKRGGFVFS